MMNYPGNILHRHATGVPLLEFFRSVNMDLTDNCLTIDDGTQFCSNGNQNLEFYINGNNVASIAYYVI